MPSQGGSIRRPGIILYVLLAATATAHAADVTIDREQFFSVDAKRVFPFFFMLAPPADAKTPAGDDAWRELKKYGAVFHHCNVLPGKWGAEGEARIDRMLARSAETGLLCAVAIRDLDAPRPGDAAAENELRRVIAKYRNHPGLGIESPGSIQGSVVDISWGRSSSATRRDCGLPTFEFVGAAKPKRRPLAISLRSCIPLFLAPHCGGGVVGYSTSIRTLCPRMPGVTCNVFPDVSITTRSATES